MTCDVIEILNLLTFHHIIMQNYLCWCIVFYNMKAMSYKKFRESEAPYYDTIEGRMSRAEVIKKLESFIVERLGEGQDFFDQYKVKEA